MHFPRASAGGTAGAAVARSRPRFALALLALAAHAPARAADEMVALPPFMVEETAKGPAWRYARVQDYEVLSRCDDSATRSVLAEYHRLHQLLAEILPPRLRLELSTPQTLVLHDEELHAATAPELLARALGGDPASAAAASGYRFLPNLRLWDRDAVMVFMIVRDAAFERSRLALTQDYLAFLLKSRVPALPAWFVQGMLTLYRDVSYEADGLLLPPMEWISAQHTRALRNDPARAPRPLMLRDFLAARPPAAPPGAKADPAQRWQAQAALLVRWGLEPAADRRAALWKFAERAALEGSTEKLFRECFGLSFAAADEALAEYRSQAVRSAMAFRPKKLEPLETWSPANATRAQIARIKGDLERLEVRYVQEVLRDLAEKYREQARRTLTRAYDRGERDSGLLAVMGLCEVDAGNDAGARELLEAAAKTGEPLRPRAWFELARLRLATMRAEAAPTAERWLAPAQAAEVLHPLFRARELHPPLPEVYALIGDVWWACRAAPKRAHLVVLDEGVALFPLRVELVLRAAELNQRHGYTVESARLAALGRGIAADEPMRARFAELQREPSKK